MEPVAPVRPPTLTRLCILSFINQGAVFPMYLMGIPASYYMRDMDPQDLRAAASVLYGKLMDPEQQEPLFRFLGILQEHGVALMSVFALRTLVRFLGTLRMWRLKGDGFHIYTSAQLLGILVPMLIAGSGMFNPLGLVAALLWCYMYWVHRKAMIA